MMFEALFDHIFVVGRVSDLMCSFGLRDKETKPFLINWPFSSRDCVIPTIIFILSDQLGKLIQLIH